MSIVYVPAELLSKKQINNIPVDEDFACVNNEKMFLSKDNTVYLVPKVVRLYSDRGLLGDAKKIYENMGFFQKYFLAKQLNYEHSASEYIQNWVERLDFTNREFLKWFDEILREDDFPGKGHDDFQPDFDPTKQKIRFSRSLGDDDIKLGKDLRVNDIRALDVWGPKTQYSSGANYRRANKIPLWQKGNIRQYDRSNDGLQTSDDRASLETPIYGYNMEEIYRSMEPH